MEMINILHGAYSNVFYTSSTRSVKIDANFPAKYDLLFFLRPHHTRSFAIFDCPRHGRLLYPLWNRSFLPTSVRD